METFLVDFINSILLSVLILVIFSYFFFFMLCVYITKNRKPFALNSHSHVPKVSSCFSEQRL